MSHKVGQPLYANKPHCCFVVGGTFVKYKKPIFVTQVYLVQGYQGLVLALVIVLVLPMDGFQGLQKQSQNSDTLDLCQR